MLRHDRRPHGIDRRFDRPKLKHRRFSFASIGEDQA